MIAPDKPKLISRQGQRRGPAGPGRELDDPLWTSWMRGELAPWRPAPGFARRVLMDIFGTTWLLIGIISGAVLLVFFAILALTAAASVHVDAASARRKAQ
ncbi:MAG: hypothetical protein ABW215_24005 [Kibdelosporangium sp.]